ncbi:MAG: adenylate kinase [Proteobacteria bacterium]|nr:adenylate kinase [Pseudomonadota bacterium]
MQRVLVLGCPGAGKSVLARRMAAATGLPVVHLDRHYWGEGWTEPAPEAWHARLAGLLEAPRWIMDGNYAGTLPQRLAHADTAVLLEAPRWLCLVRVLRRALASLGRRRGEDMAPGCPERIDWAFITYVWRFPAEQRPRVARALEGFAGRVVTLRGAREMDAFVEGLDHAP